MPTAASRTALGQAMWWSGAARESTCLASGYNAVLVLKSSESRSLSHFSAFFRGLRFTLVDAR
jgi:hypothetical protein